MVKIELTEEEVRLVQTALDNLPAKGVKAMANVIGLFNKISKAIEENKEVPSEPKKSRV